MCYHFKSKRRGNRFCEAAEESVGNFMAWNAPQKYLSFRFDGCNARVSITQRGSGLCHTAFLNRASQPSKRKREYFYGAWHAIKFPTRHTLRFCGYRDLKRLNTSMNHGCSEPNLRVTTLQRRTLPRALIFFLDLTAARMRCF